MNTELKWTIGGVVFLLLFTVGCYLWYHSETEPYRQDYAKTQQHLREWTASQQAIETPQTLDDSEARGVAVAGHKAVSVEKATDQTEVSV